MAGNIQLKRRLFDPRDEFYTRLDDIEKELHHYKEHFRNKVVYCNCDDPRSSNFVRFFVENFQKFQLSALIATGYSKDGRGVLFQMDHTNRIHSFFEIKKQIQHLRGDGDFRSEECIGFLKKADILCTNPPFSLSTSLLQLCFTYQKDFLVIGNQTLVTTKTGFPWIRDDQLRLGYTRPKYFINGYAQNDVKPLGFCVWYTSFPVQIFLNFNPSCSFKSRRYPRYQNYDAIEVSRVEWIPFDYDGVMGVPITYLFYHDPSKYRILGINKKGFFQGQALGSLFMEKYRLQGGKGHYSEKMISVYYEELDGKVVVPFTRVFIQKIKKILKKSKMPQISSNSFVLGGKKYGKKRSR